MPYTWILAYSQGLTIRQIEADDEETMISGALASAPSLLRLLKIAKLLKMLKLLRVVKIKKILMKFEEYIVTDSMNLLVTFCNLTVKIIVTAHYMGCAFYFVGMENWKSDGRGWIVEK
jgi:hyperpolarization activated cyclic nucleotide-gated potassium channel 2